MLKIFGAAVAAATLATSAMAMTITSTNGPDSGVPAGQTLIYDFDTITPTVGTQITGDYGIINASIANVSAAPLGTTPGTNYLSVPLAAIPGTATLLLGGSYSAVSFYWGSIDTYNTVTFYKGGTLVGSITGGSVPPAPADGSQGNALNNRRVNFDFGGLSADRMVLSSDQFAFELDTITGSAVPEPATWAMLVVGMGLVGGSMRRRRSVATVAA